MFSIVFPEIVVFVGDVMTIPLVVPVVNEVLANVEITLLFTFKLVGEPPVINKTVPVPAITFCKVGRAAMFVIVFPLMFNVAGVPVLAIALIDPEVAVE